jgi:hypothetical protein
MKMIAGIILGSLLATQGVQAQFGAVEDLLGDFETEGVELVTDAMFEDVQVYVRNLEPAEARERLAEALVAEWVRTERGTLRLTRSDELQEEIDEQQRERARQALERRLEQKQGLAGASAEQVVQAAREYDPSRTSGESRTTPGDPALLALVELIGQDALLEVPPYESQYWTNLPGTAAKALPVGSARILQDFNRLQQELNTLLAESPDNPWTIMQGSLRGTLEAKDAEALSLRVSRFPNQLWLWLGMYGKEGQLLSVGRLEVPIDDPANELDWQDNAEFTWPEPTQAMLQALGRGVVLGEPQASLAPLLSPDAFDPLRLQVVPALEQIAERRGASMLVVLPDSAVSRMAGNRPSLSVSWSFDPVEDEQEFATRMAELGVELSVGDDGVIMGRLTEPWNVETMNLDRQRLAAYLGSVEAGEGLRGHGLLAEREREAYRASTLFRFYNGQVIPARQGVFAGSSILDYYFAYLIGHSSDAEWQALLAGERTTIGAHPERRSWAWHATGLRLVSEDGEIADALRVPPIAYPNGVPANTTLSLLREPGYRLAFNWQGRRMMWEVRSVGSHYASMPNESGLEGIGSFVGSVDLYEGDVLTPRIHFSDSLYADSVPYGQGFALTEQGLTYDELPEEVREIIERGYAEMKDFLEEARETEDAAP